VFYGIGPYGDSALGVLPGPSTAGTHLDGMRREVLGFGDGTLHADRFSRESLASGTGVIHGDALTREAIAHGIGNIRADFVVREILLIPETAAFVGGLVREVLAAGIPTIHVEIIEGGNAHDGLVNAPIYFAQLTEQANATDTLRVVHRHRKRAHTPLPQNHPDPLVRDIQAKVNEIQQGRLNSGFARVYLNPNSETTTITDPRIGPYSNISLTAVYPTVPEAISVEYIKGQAILHHANSPDTGRQYTYNVIS
jgi:hypothetical protein